MSKPYREQVQAAIHALGEMSSAEFRQHIADGSVPVTQWTPEQRARWTAVDDRLRPLIEAWVQADDEDDPQQVWVEVLSHVMHQRDLALARVRKLDAARAKAVRGRRVEAARVERAREVLADSPCRGRDEPCGCLGCTTGGGLKCARSGPCSCLTCRVAEVLR